MMVFLSVSFEPTTKTDTTKRTNPYMGVSEFGGPRIGIMDFGVQNRVL